MIYERCKRCLLKFHYNSWYCYCEPCRLYREITQGIIEKPKGNRCMRCMRCVIPYLNLGTFFCEDCSKYMESFREKNESKATKE